MRKGGVDPPFCVCVLFIIVLRGTGRPLRVEKSDSLRCPISMRGHYSRIPKDTVVYFGTRSYNFVCPRIGWYEFVRFGNFGMRLGD
jgi:hypothetical protein